MRALKNNRIRLLVLALLLLAAVLLYRQCRFVPAAPLPAVAPGAGDLALPRRTVILYFIAADGLQLVAEDREIAGCREEQDCLRDTLAALLAGPTGNLVPLFPPPVQLLAVSRADETVTISLDRSAFAGHPGGSLSELLTTLGLADTVAANFPHLRAVRILVAGQAVVSFKGHIDLRQPIGADFSWVRGAGAGQPDAGR